MYPVVHLDFETYSVCPIELGPVRYASDPSTEVICMAYTIDDQPPQLWVPSMPLPEILTNKQHHYIAWNIAFERAIIRHTLKLSVAPLDQWSDPMASARALALPGSLGGCGAAVGVEQDKRKMDDGRKIMLRFCKPYRGERYYG